MRTPVSGSRKSDMVNVLLIVGMMLTACGAADGALPSRSTGPTSPSAVPSASTKSPGSSREPSVLGVPTLTAAPRTVRAGDVVALVGANCSRPEIYWHDHQSIIQKSAPERLPLRTIPGGTVRAEFRVPKNRGLGSGLFALVCQGNRNADVVVSIR